MIGSLSFRFTTAERRLKRVIVMAEDFIAGVLEQPPDHDYIQGFKFQDRYGTIPPDSRVESFWFDYNPSCFMVLLSNPTWPEVPDGESPPFLRESRLEISRAFVDRSRYVELVDKQAADAMASFDVFVKDATPEQLVLMRSEINEQLYDRERRK